MHDRRPGLLTLSRRTIARLRSRGPGEVLELAAIRGREFISSQNEIVFHVRIPSRIDADGSFDDLIFKRAEPSDAKRYAHDVGTDSVGSFKHRLSGSTNCFLVYKEGLVVHATWTTTASSWVRELHRYFCPPHDDLYVYESFTRPEVRGRGVYPFALRHIAAWAAEQRLARIWVGVEKDNPASLKSVAKVGFTPAFVASVERSFGRITVHPSVGPAASDCRDCLSEQPCSARRDARP